ncbi:MAG: hydroxymethylbilane synthase, partial [Bacillota bacterium]|nr:hydroxymethylbilane synthase [Bacillota bacterium]
QGALLRGEVDLAVHSAKDLPLEEVPGLVVAAYPERAHPGDLFISRGPGWQDLSPGMRVGTSSVRRRYFLQRSRADLVFEEIRGNVDTRLQKLEDGEVEGLVLAAAGWERLGLQAEHVERLPYDVLLPAPGQGALAVEVGEDRKDLLELVGAIDGAEVRQAVEMERALLAFLAGGCWSALGVLAQREGEGWHLRAAWGEGGGQAVEARGEEPRALVEAVGRKLLEGARAP